MKYFELKAKIKHYREVIAKHKALLPPLYLEDLEDSEKRWGLNKDFWGMMILRGTLSGCAANIYMQVLPEYPPLDDSETTLVNHDEWNLSYHLRERNLPLPQFNSHVEVFGDLNIGGMQFQYLSTSDLSTWEEVFNRAEPRYELSEIIPGYCWHLVRASWDGSDKNSKLCKFKGVVKMRSFKYACDIHMFFRHNGILFSDDIKVYKDK